MTRPLDKANKVFGNKYGKSKLFISRFQGLIGCGHGIKDCPVIV